MMFIKGVGDGETASPLIQGRAVAGGRHLYGLAWIGGIWGQDG